MPLQKRLTLQFTIQSVQLAIIFGRDDVVRRVVVSPTGFLDEALKPVQDAANSGRDMVRKVSVNAAVLSGEVLQLSQDGTGSGRDMVRKLSFNAAGPPEEVLKHVQDGTGSGRDMVRKVSVNAAGLPVDVLKLSQDGTGSGRDMVRKVSITAAGLPEEVLKHSPDATSSGRDVVRKVSISATGLPEEVSKLSQDGPGNGYDVVRKVSVNASVLQEEVLKHSPDCTSSGRDVVRKVSVIAPRPPEDVLKLSQDGTGNGRDMVRKVPAHASGLPEVVLKLAQNGTNSGLGMVRKALPNAAGVLDEKHMEDNAMRTISVNSAGGTAMDAERAMTRRAKLTRKGFAGHAAVPLDMLTREPPSSADEAALNSTPVVRTMKSNDATRNPISDFIAELLTSLGKRVALSCIATILQKSIEGIHAAAQSQAVGLFVGIFCLLAGCLAALLESQMNLARRFNDFCVRPATLDAGSGDSDGKSGDSSSDDEQHIWNMRTLSVEAQAEVTTSGLLWKLERRFTQDLKSHQGSLLTSTDRFSFLESWDLRFFTLDTESSAVMLSYVSELQNFAPVVFEVKSIENQILQIPCMRSASFGCTKKKGTATVTEYYAKYFEKLRLLGYKVPENDAWDPAMLHCITVQGIRHGNNDGSRTVGRLKIKTLVSEQQTMSRMCLAATSLRDSHTWYREISRILQRSGHLEHSVDKPITVLKRRESDSPYPEFEALSSFQEDAESLMAPMQIPR